MRHRMAMADTPVLYRMKLTRTSPKDGTLTLVRSA